MLVSLLVFWEKRRINSPVVQRVNEIAAYKKKFHEIPHSYTIYTSSNNITFFLANIVNAVKQTRQLQLDRQSPLTDRVSKGSAWQI